MRGGQVYVAKRGELQITGEEGEVYSIMFVPSYSNPNPKIQPPLSIIINQ